MAERKKSTIERILGPLIMLVMLQILIPLVQQIMEAIAKVVPTAPEEVPAIFSDNFDDNSMDTSIWELNRRKVAEVAERNQRLEVNLPQGADTGGYVTKNSYDLSSKQITIDIGEISGSGVYGCFIVINSAKVTTDDPNVNTSGDRYLLGYYFGAQSVKVYRGRADESPTLRKQMTNLTNVTKLRIKISDDTIRFYCYDGSWKLIYSEPFAFASKTMYIHIYGGTGTYGIGNVYIDNFSLELV